MSEWFGNEKITSLPWMLKRVLGDFVQFWFTWHKFKVTHLCIDREIFKEWSHEGQTCDAHRKTLM